MKKQKDLRKCNWIYKTFKGAFVPFFYAQFIYIPGWGNNRSIGHKSRSPFGLEGRLETAGVIASLHLLHVGEEHQHRQGKM